MTAVPSGSSEPSPADLAGDPYLSGTVEQFLEALAARSPAPGGGAAAALTCAMAASLVEMATSFSTLTAMASTPLVIQASTTSFCLAGSRSVGPSQRRSTPSSAAASSAPFRQEMK